MASAVERHAPLEYSAVHWNDCMARTLNDLTDIRSQLAEGLEAYLQSFVDLSAWDKVFLFLPKIRPLPTLAACLYQRPYVVNRDRLDEAARQRRVAADLRAEFGLGEA